LLAYVEMFGRDRGRLTDCRARLNESPLGAAALAGSPHPIDPRKTAKALGFDRPMANSLDAVSDRDYVVEFIAAASLTAVHLSRLAEEIVIWCSAPFRFIALSDAFTTGSSIMPQKRNPDAAELTRAKTGRILGSFVAICTILKGLPLTYQKDMQEDKEPLFDAADSLELGVAAMAGMIRDLKANPQRMRAVASADYSVATDLADWLVRKVGLPFRQAHHVTGTLVGIAADKGVDLDKLSLTEMQAVEPSIDRSVYSVLTVEASVAARKSLGGTSPANVARATKEARSRFIGKAPRSAKGRGR
jgi:argininosuccinate lyase